MVKKNSGYTIRNLVKIDPQGTLYFDLVSVQGDVIHIVAAYAPSQRDVPEYFEIIETNITVKDSGNPKMVIGDLNVPLNMKLDTYNYKSNYRPTSRDLINS